MRHSTATQNGKNEGRTLQQQHHHILMWQLRTCNSLHSYLYQTHTPCNVMSLTLRRSGAESPVMIFLIADSSACYITYCCCTFMLKSFTVHPPIYYFHECISRRCITFRDFPSVRTHRQHFARVSAEPKQKAMKDKAAKTNRPNLILAHPNRAWKLLVDCIKNGWLLATVHSMMIEMCRLQWLTHFIPKALKSQESWSVLRRENDIFVSALQHYKLVFGFKKDMADFFKSWVTQELSAGKMVSAAHWQVNPILPTK